MWVETRKFDQCVRRIVEWPGIVFSKSFQLSLYERCYCYYEELGALHSIVVSILVDVRGMLHSIYVY